MPDLTRERAVMTRIIHAFRRLTTAIGRRRSPHFFYQIGLDLALAELGIAPDCLDRRFYSAQVLHGVYEGFSPSEAAALAYFLLPRNVSAAVAEERIGDWEQAGRIRPGFSVMANDLAGYLRPRMRDDARASGHAGLADNALTRSG